MKEMNVDDVIINLPNVSYLTKVNLILTSWKKKNKAKLLLFIKDQIFSGNKKYNLIRRLLKTEKTARIDVKNQKSIEKLRNVNKQKQGYQHRYSFGFFTFEFSISQFLTKIEIKWSKTFNFNNNFKTFVNSYRPKHENS